MRTPAGRPADPGWSQPRGNGEAQAIALLADTFATVTFLVIAGGVLLLLAIGRWHGRSGTDIMDGDRKQRWGVQAEIEARDIGEMVDAENARRRRRGRREVSQEEIVAKVGREQLERLRADDAGRSP